MGPNYYLDYEPVFLMDHIEFGSKFRLFKMRSIEIFLQQNTVLETSIDMRFSTLALHVEEMASYEDLGSILFAIKGKFENNIPILQSLLTYDTSTAILSKLLAQQNSISFTHNFYLDRLLHDEILPQINGINASKVQRKIGEILTVDFKKNTKPERIDAYYRIKHGPVLMSSATRYAGKKYEYRNVDLPGVLLKSNTLDTQKKHTLPSPISNSPFIPFGFKMGTAFRENTFKAIDISTRIQQLLCVTLLLEFHPDFVSKNSLDKAKLFQKGLELEKLCFEMSYL